jgi:hypothetical protein
MMSEQTLDLFEAGFDHRGNIPHSEEPDYLWSKDHDSRCGEIAASIIRKLSRHHSGIFVGRPHFAQHLRDALESEIRAALTPPNDRQEASRKEPERAQGNTVSEVRVSTDLAARLQALTYYPQGGYSPRIAFPITEQERACIVRAVKTYDDMLAALHRAAVDLNAAITLVEHRHREPAHGARQTLEIVHAAIAKATATTDTHREASREDS